MGTEKGSVLLAPRPTPDPWEAVRVVWSCTDPYHFFYYLTLKSNGW